MHPTMSSEYFFVGKNIKKFVKVTTRDTQLLKLSKTCNTLRNLSSVYVNPTFCVKIKTAIHGFRLLQLCGVRH